MIGSKVIIELKATVANVARLFRLAWETDKRLVAAYYLTAIIGGVAPVVGGLVVKAMIDSFNAGVGYGLALGILLLRFGMPWLESVGYWGINQSVIDFLLRYKLQTRINYLFHQKTLSLDVAYYEDDKVQNLLARCKETMIWSVPDVLRQLSYVVRALTTTIFSVIVLAGFGWWIPVVVIVSTIPRLIANSRIGQALWSMYGSGAPEIRKFWYFSYIMSDPLAVRELRIFQAENFILDKYRKTQQRLYELNKKPLVKQFKLFLWLPLMEMGLLLMISYTKLNDTLTGMMTVGSLMLLIELLLRLGGTISGMANNVAQIIGNNLFVEDLFKTLSLPQIIKEPERPVKIETRQVPKIEFRNVSFSYPKEVKTVLNGVSFVIEPGENIALVGSNGAGKTTIIKLLCRFYDASKGQILINGVDIREISRNDLYTMLGTLFQDFMKYHFTVRENIALKDETEVDSALMKKAAKMAGIEADIKKLPKQYEQPLGKEFEDGMELSGGQWQKLAVARAFYEQAPVLILDEPTSAIDAEAEFEIFSNLQNVYREKTLVLVSHRFSTVRNADKILVIDGGKIIEQGSHTELVEKNGKYARMFRIQAKGYEN